MLGITVFANVLRKTIYNILIIIPIQQLFVIVIFSFQNKHINLIIRIISSYFLIAIEFKILLDTGTLVENNQFLHL